MPQSTTKPTISHRLVRGFEVIRRKPKLGSDGVLVPLLKTVDVEKADRCPASELRRSTFWANGEFIAKE